MEGEGENVYRNDVMRGEKFIVTTNFKSRNIFWEVRGVYVEEEKSLWRKGKWSGVKWSGGEERTAE